MGERYDRSPLARRDRVGATGRVARDRSAISRSAVGDVVAAVVALVVAATVVLGASGCSTPVTREAVRDNYRKALVASGEDPDLAKCVTDRFFEHRSNAEVRAFQKRAHLTADETDEFSRLAALCRTV